MMNPAPKPDLEFLQQYMKQFWRMRRAYEDIFKPLLLQFNLTANEKDVLLFLHNNPQYNTATHIVKYRMISKSLVCKSVDNLVGRGILKAASSPNDRRTSHLSIAPPAYDIVCKLALVQQKMLSGLQAEIAPEEYQSLLQSMEKMNTALKNCLKQGDAAHE